MNIHIWFLSKLPAKWLERALVKKPQISSVHIVTVRDMKEMCDLVESIYNSPYKSNIMNDYLRQSDVN